MECHDTELLALLIAERARDQLQLDRTARESQRAGGVSWSGMAAAPTKSRTDDARLEAARIRLTARRDWRESAPGRFAIAISQVQGAARALHAAGERAREATSRGLQNELDTCDAQTGDLRRQVIALIAGLRAARRALRAAREP